MSDFIANSNMYNIITENELAVVLSHYNSDFVLSVIEDAMRKRFEEVPISSRPNVVSAWEQNFKMIQSKYEDLPESKSEVSRIRNETYQEIIDSVCKEFNMSFTTDQNIDLYSAASVIYDFLVSNFTSNLVNFFANYIYKERNSIYDSLNLAEYKKNKDSSTVYGKKIYKDIKLAVINANIDIVITFLCGIDIDFFNLVNILFDPPMASFINNIISTNDDFFKKYYAQMFETDLRAALITDIRFKIQNLGMVVDEMQHNALT